MIFIEILLGVFLGFLIGLIPNLHINVISYIFLYLGFFNKFLSIYFFLAFSISHLLTSYLPSTSFSIPNSENILQVFCSQKFFLKGDGKFAIYLMLLSSFLTSFLIILFLPFLFLVFSIFLNIYYIVYIAILFVLLYFIFSQKTILKKLVVFSIIIFSGVLGIFTLKYNYFFKYPLFISIFALFSIPAIIDSILANNKFVIQKKSFKKINLKSNFFIIPISILTSFLMILIPSFSSSQASILFSKIQQNLKAYKYLLVYSSISFSSLIFSFFLGIYFFKPRLGYVAILLENNVLSNINIVLFSVTIVLSTILVIFLIYLIIDKYFLILYKLNYKLINILILSLSIFFIIYLTNFYSLILLFLGFLIGYLPYIFNVNRLYVISYLMIPTLLFYI